MIPLVEVIGLPRATAMRQRATARLVETLAAHPVRASSARLTFTDQNGPKGGVACRCGRHREPDRVRGRLHVQDEATTPGLALTGALTKLERRLQRRQQLVRDSRRRPKKYFAAARVLRDEGSA